MVSMVDYSKIVLKCPPTVLIAEADRFQLTYGQQWKIVD